MPTVFFHKIVIDGKNFHDCAAHKPPNYIIEQNEKKVNRKMNISLNNCLI